MIVPTLLVLVFFIISPLPGVAHLIFSTNAGQIPFIPDALIHPHRLQAESTRSTPLRVAIIGAGAAGSSASYFLSHQVAKHQLGVGVEITLYESSDHVGGRADVVRPWLQDEQEGEEEPIESGASIFAEVRLPPPFPALNIHMILMT
jgi:hypothetical protein